MAFYAQHTCALPEGIRYYLLRDSVMVPLVPVDQLPFQLQGIPRSLNHRQMSDEGWKFLSDTDEAPVVIPIHAPTSTFPSRSVPTAKPRFHAPDHHVRNDSQTKQAEKSQTDDCNIPPPATEKAPWIPGSTAVAIPERPTSLTDSFASIYQKDAQRLGYRKFYPSGIEPDPSKKEYCTHWLATGECAFVSVGCKYKHEMPSAEKLREIGFTQGMPRWWKEKSAIVAKGPTWMQLRMAQGDKDGERTNEVPAARAFPDPSTFRTNKNHERAPLSDDIQHPRDRLGHTAMPKPTTTLRPTPPSTPVQVAAQPASQVSDLLIDLDDTSAPPPSPQLSNSSSVSAASSDTEVSSSRTSESPPPRPAADSAQLPKTNKKHKDSDSASQPRARHHSPMSWASGCEGDIEPAKPSSKQKSAVRKAPKQAAAPTQQPGLATSKYATGNHQSKTTEHRGRNANRKMTQQKSNGVHAPELHAKMEKLRHDTPQKDKTSKGARNVEGQVRGASVAVVPAKHASAR